MRLERRKFIGAAAAAGISALLPEALEAKPVGIAKRKLGRTEAVISEIGFGAIVLMGHEPVECARIVHEAVDRGVTYFDVAPSYGNGEAEEKMGPALEAKRDGVFLACKTARRDAAGAAEELERSLRRLRTNHFDLYQLHGIASMEELNTALAPGGAIETLVKARDAGKTRYLGFSAHSAEAALSAMSRFRFDTILFPVNWGCWLAGNFGPQVIRAARSRGMGCLALKSMAHRPWPRDAARTSPNCWYEPFSDPADVELGLRFTLSQSITAALPPGDLRLFRLALDIAERGIKKLGKRELAELTERASRTEPLFRA